MKQNWAENFKAVVSSKKFTKFFEGIDFTLANGENVSIKIESFSKRKSLPGYKFAKFSFVTKVIGSNGVVGHGYGEAENELLSFQKSIAEAIERAFYLSFKEIYGLTSSNGWAVHLTEKSAKTSAMQELLERDAVLVHWLTNTPFQEIEPNSFPKWIKAWINSELAITKDSVRIFIATSGYLPVIQCVTTNELGQSFTSQATSKSLENAIYRAFAETFRIKSNSVHSRIETYSTVESNKVATAWDHAMAYGNGQSLPKNMFGNEISFKDAERINRNLYKNLNTKPLALKFQNFKCGDLFVSNCTSEKVQNLFFGGTEYALNKGLINLARLREVAKEYVLNPLPHCVP